MSPTSMQINHGWSCVPRLANLKLCYNRFTLSRIATAYTALALVHCIAQILLQVRGLGIEHTQSEHLDHTMKVGDVTDQFAILDSRGAILVCHGIPGHTSDPQPCHEYLFNASGIATTSPSNASLDVCTQVLAWPAQIVHQAIRESIAMIVFQVWLVGISIVAIITESIPHVVAALVTQLISTAWSLFYRACTERLYRRFDTLVTHLACNDVDPMPGYWKSKLNNEIPILALNAASLVVCVFLSWKLCKQYGVQSFARVGGCKRIHHLYLLVLVLSVCLQLTAFFLTTSLILWIEQLFDGPVATLADKQTAYLSAFIGTSVLILPWLYMGWTAVRRERRRMMAVFLFTSAFLTVSQMGMFFSPIYRLTFSTWNFFGSITVIAYILLNISFFMALVCRYFFGRGLAHFLQVQEALGECDFTPVYIERGSHQFQNVEDPEGGTTMPWDMEGRGVVKKLSLPLDQNHDCASLSPSQSSIPRSAFLNPPAPRSSFRVSCSQASESHDPPVIIDAAAILNKKRRSGTTSRSAADDGSGIASSDRLSRKLSVSFKSARSECPGGSSFRSEENSAYSIHRGVGSPSSSPVRTRPLVGFPSGVKQKPNVPLT